MNLETKAQIARGSLSLLLFVAVFFLLSLVVLVVCAGLQINPFKETTSSFLIAAFMGLVGLAAMLVLLNVATNISPIAEARIAELHLDPRPASFKKWAVLFLSAAVLIVGFIFVGTYLSKERYLRVVRQQADEVLGENRASLDQIGRLLASASPDDFKRNEEIREFLANRRRDLPHLTIIYSAKFEAKTAFYQANEYNDFSDPHRQEHKKIYYTCLQNIDCSCLNRFFSGENAAPLQKYTIRDDRFYIYIPVTTSASRYVLLFDSWNSYGKIGS